MRMLPVSAKDRIEKDSLGEIRVAAGALWGAQTQRAVENFRIGRARMPAGLIRAIALVKWAAAETNGELGELPVPLAAAIAAAALEVAEGRHAGEFPLGVMQTGSGTSTNMNVNEVIAHLAGERLGQGVHANDHVNRCQSSNDVIPTAIHVSAALAVHADLLPALARLAAAIGAKADEVGAQVKIGRTHLMDALPVTFGQEMRAWRSQVNDAAARIGDAVFACTAWRSARRRWARASMRIPSSPGARSPALPRGRVSTSAARRTGSRAWPARMAPSSSPARCAAPPWCCSRSRTTCAG